MRLSATARAGAALAIATAVSASGTRGATTIGACAPGNATLLGNGTSLSMHESQSRLWENLVGRSLTFWQHYYPKLQATFSDALGAVSLDAFYRAINRVAPSLIRIEADEVTYNLHIMVRFELENELVEGQVAVDDLPEAWNAKMYDYLGVRPDSDANGVLQDIHWSLGAMGYFPTYTLGAMAAAQIYAAAVAALPEIPEAIGKGDFAPLMGWLGEHVHGKGSLLSTADLIESATGQPLSDTAFKAHLRARYLDG